MFGENINKTLFGIKSSRHHYIPRFLIEGFTNQQGQIFVYDKFKNKILDDLRYPKSIFFEKDRNTIEFNDNPSSFIEDTIYSYVDNKTSKTVKKYQFYNLAEIDFNLNDETKFFEFLIFLYWRIPKTDSLAKEIIENKNLKIAGFEINKLKIDSTLNKLFRVGLFEAQLKEMIKFGETGVKYSNIHSFEDQIFVLGDNPILFRNQMNKLSEFNDFDILISISSSRIYSSTNNAMDNFDFKNAILYNAAIIHQSQRYVVSGNFDTLSKSIEYYELLKKNNLLKEISKTTFSTF